MKRIKEHLSIAIAAAEITKTMDEQQKHCSSTIQQYYHSYDDVLEYFKSMGDNLKTMPTDRKRPASPTNDLVIKVETKRPKHDQSFVEIQSVVDVRKRSFSHWPLKQPSLSQMIASGFFSCNVSDRVICIYCNLICQQWILTDDPSEVHRILSPNCCYVQSNLVSIMTPTKVILNETPNGASSTEMVLAQACNKAFIEIPKRHSTFVKWPENKPAPPVDEMVRAGFFYSGTGTIVSCFYCNGSLQNWSAKDNPTNEHARWFPHCGYIRQLCGDDLYQKIQQSKQFQKKSGISSTTTQLLIPDENTLTKYVAARLDLPESQRLLNTFRLSIVKRCYEDQLRLKLDDFPSDSDLFMACLILQKQIDVIDGKKENIIIPSRKLRDIANKNKEEHKTFLNTTEPANTAELEKSQTTIPSSSSHSSVCVLCMTDEKCLACMPCGHVATCVPCGHSLRTCPMCRQAIDSFVRVYISST
ncbi:unnamed protein product [Didymodactylos carnosus]|uniref:RING-type domain-containing protein n=1 Tax=Didymodactylos carnosus TaxID=1234261 RepID=A0A814RLA6_9BILA|nr:unnamed protein product [Didymodactylos carnosus]CAF3898204.1 unnamed protein product [Didymodactylos carnosus]